MVKGTNRQAHPISHLTSGTWRADTAGNGRRTFLKSPTLISCPWFRKAMQKWRKGESVSLTMSLHDLWEAAVRASGSTRCPLLPRAWQTAPWGGGDWSHRLLSSWDALCLHPGTTAHLSNTVQTISPSFSSCLFCCQKNQKAKKGDSSFEEDTITKIPTETSNYFSSENISMTGCLRMREEQELSGGQSLSAWHMLQELAN